MSFLFLLADYQYTRPFLQPAPLWDYWPWLALPLCLGISIVYKSIRCADMRSVPREALGIFLWIVGVMALVAGGLAGLVKLLNYAGS